MILLLKLRSDALSKRHRAELAQIVVEVAKHGVERCQFNPCRLCPVA